MLPRSSKLLLPTCLVAGAAILGCLTSTGADAPQECTKSASIKHQTAALHGVPCTKDDECMYGYCKKGSMQAGFDTTKGVCTKDCSCGPGSACNVDDGKDGTGKASYLCIKSTSYSPPQSECAQFCKSNTDCANIPGPSCLGSSDHVTTGAGYKICGFSLN